MIDIVFCILLLWGTYQGLRKGLIKALFFVLGFAIALAAATKLSAAVSVYLSRHYSYHYSWLPLVSFILVFATVMLGFILLGKMLQKTGEVVMLGWLNRFGGMLVYILLYTTLYSVLLFYLQNMKLITTAQTNHSFFYPWLQPWAPVVIEKMSLILPFLKGCFDQISGYFEGVANNLN